MKMLDHFFGHYFGMGIVLWIVFFGLMLVIFIVKLTKDEGLESYIDKSIMDCQDYDIKLDFSGIMKIIFCWPIMIPKSAYFFKMVIEQAEKNRRRDRELAKLRSGE